MWNGVEGLLMEADILPLLEAPSRDSLEVVVHRIRAGEWDAFEDLVALTQQRILGVAWRILGDRDLARDAAQETYLRVFKSLASFRLGERFEAWMIRIAVHVCYDLARRRGPRPVAAQILETLEDPAAPLHAEEAVLLDQRRALISHALQTLPEGERTALILRDLEGLPTEEVARILGVRSVTIRSQVASARSKVQTYCHRLLTRTHGGRP